MQKSRSYAVCCWHLEAQAVLGLPGSKCMASALSFHLACEIMAKQFILVNIRAITAANSQMNATILLSIMSSKTTMKGET